MALGIIIIVYTMHSIVIKMYSFSIHYTKVYFHTSARNKVILELAKNYTLCVKVF